MRAFKRKLPKVHGPHDPIEEQVNNWIQSYGLYTRSRNTTDCVGPPFRAYK
jgi:hypothetical protein